MPFHANATGLDLHEDKRVKEPARVASTANISLALPGGSMDGIALVAGDRLLLKNQTNQAENGIYVWTSASTSLTRSSDADGAGDFPLGWSIYVREGTAYGSSFWVYTQSAAVTLGTTALTFVNLSATGPTGPQGTQGPVGAGGPAGAFVVSGAAPYVCIQDQKPLGTLGGTFTSGAFQTRTLNTKVADSAGISSLTSNQVTLLQGGTYRAAARATGAACDRHQIRLQNITDGVTILTGTNAFAPSATTQENTSSLAGSFVIFGAKVLELQHRCQTNRNSDGFGFATSWGTEVYAILEFWLEGPVPVWRPYDWPDEVIDMRYRVLLDQRAQRTDISGSLNLP